MKSKLLNNFDIIIIGAGSGGLTFSAVASQLGFKVALIEKHKMGGDCLNYGCVPSKAFLYSSKKTKNFNQTFKHIKNSINTIAPHDSIERFSNLGVTVIKGKASFISKNKITVNDRIISAKKIIIATGSKPFIPQIQGLSSIKYLTNENIFNLKEKPKHIVISGAGPIGIEMATAFNNIGSKVTVILRGSQILKNDDQELAEMLKEKLQKEGINFIENTNINKVSKLEHGIKYELNQNNQTKTIKSSHFLIATGRTPNSKELNLEKAHIKTDKKDFIITNKHLKTTNKKVYAIGDVTGKALFTHIASYQAGLLIKRLLFADFLTKENYSSMPWTTFTSPELSQAGLTEKKARALYGNSIKIYSVNFKENDRAITENAQLGKAKLILNNKGKTLGVSILGKNSGEIIQQWTQIIAKQQKPSKILNQIYIYPTISELNRNIAAQVYKRSLFSQKVQKISKILFNLIGSKI